MAYSIDGTDILINGWEQGISDNPYEGLNDMRGVNIISIPGEASVSFSQTSITLPSVTGSVVSADAGTNVITSSISTGTLTSGQAITFTGASLPTGITAGTVYWLFISGSTPNFVIYTNPYGDGSEVNITATGTGTFASINMADIKYFEKTCGVALDSNGRAWNFGGKFLGNDVTSTVGLRNGKGNGLIWYKGYLFLFYNSRICYIEFSSDPNSYISGKTWVNEWNPATGAVAVGTAVFNTATGLSNSHDSLVGQDDVVYICDSNFIASLREKDGATFDPSNTATYIWAKQALKLPSTDTATCLEELGVNLMIGGKSNYIYPWDRTSITFRYPMKIADNYTYRLLTVNTNMYIFAGTRGRIYVTNGSQATLYKKIPDHISGIEPIINWENCCYNKNQIYFGISALNNAQTPITSYFGLWAIDITTEALRRPTIQSSPTATVSAIWANNTSSSGFGLRVAWKVGSAQAGYTSTGIDTSQTSEPYTTYVSTIETDLIPVGQFLKKSTFSNLEFKLAKALVSGESVKISYRTEKDGTYYKIGETIATSAYKPKSDFYLLPTDLLEWVQFKIELKSTATNPSYVRLKELRLRK